MAKLLLGPAISTVAENYNSGGGYSPINGIRYNQSFGVNTVESWATSASATNTALFTGVSTQYHLFYCSTTAPTASKFLAGGRSGDTVLKVYSGAMPTIAAITSKTDGLTTWAANNLVSFIPNPYSAGGDSGLKFTSGSIAESTGISATVPFTTGTVAVLGIAPGFVSASVSGTASWFYFGYADAGSTNTSLADRSFVIGTVSKIGGAGDLQIPDTNIVAGGLYKSYGFKFSIPVEYEV